MTLLAKVAKKARIALDALTFLLTHIQNFFLRYHRIVSILVAVLIPTIFIMAPKIPPTLRIEDLNGTFLESFTKFESFKRDFDVEDQLTLVLKKKTDLTAHDYCQVENWLNSEYQNNSSVKRASSIFDLRYPSSPVPSKLYYFKIFDSPCDGKINFDRLADHPIRSLFSAPDNSEMALHLQFKPKNDSSGLFYDYEKIQQLISNLKETFKEKIYIGGSLFYQISALEGFKRAVWLNLLTALIFALSYYYFYRSKLAVVALLTIIFCNHSIIRICMGLDHQKMDPLSTCLFLMLTIAIIEDYLFLSYLLFKKKIPFIEAFKKLLVSSFLTSLTTAIGFASLAASANPNIKNFAKWAAIGTMSEWFFVIILLPCVIKLFPDRAKNYFLNVTAKETKIHKIVEVTPGRRLTIAMTLILILFPFIKDQANFNYSPLDLFKDDHEIKQFSNYVKESRGTEGDISILFDDSKLITTEIIEKIKKIEGVKDVVSLDDLNPYVKDFPPSVQRLILSDFQLSKMGKIFTGTSSSRVIAQIGAIDIKSVQKIEKEIEIICSQTLARHCWPVGDVIVSKDFSLSIIDTIYSSFTFGFIPIWLIMIWLTLATQPKALLPVLISATWTPIMLLIAVILLKLKVTVVTCVVLATLLGLSGDNAIQFLMLKEDDLDDSVADYGIASLQNFILLSLVACTMFFSSFKTSQELSSLIIFSSLLMMIGDIWILRGWLKEMKA